MAKAKMKTGNPFLDADLGSVMNIGKFAEQFKVPGVDPKFLIETQRRNVEAVTKANQVAFEGAQAIVQRQVEILRRVMDETTNAVQELSKQDKPEAFWVKQTEIVKEAYEHGLVNLRELTELSTKANADAADLLTHRFAASLDELKGVLESANGAARKAAQ